MEIGCLILSAFVVSNILTSRSTPTVYALSASVPARSSLFCTQAAIAYTAGERSVRLKSVFGIDI